MNTVRMNITIPKEVAQEIKEINNKSSFITQAIIDKLQNEKRKRLESELREGYQFSLKEDIEVTKDWEHTITDGID